MPQKLKHTKEKIEVDYAYLLSKKTEILQSSKILLYAKRLYLLYMRGFRVRDIIGIILGQIEDQECQIVIPVEKSNGCIQRAEFIGEEIGVILDV